MSSDFAYVPTTGTVIGVMAGLSVLTGLVNSLSTYWMEKMTKTYVMFHVAVLVTCCIALLAKCDNRHNATYVFTDVDSSSGWSPVGFAWLFGFLSVSWTVRNSRISYPSQRNRCSSLNRRSWNGYPFSLSRMPDRNLGVSQFRYAKFCFM